MNDLRSPLRSHFGANAGKYTRSPGHGGGDDLSLLVEQLPVSAHSIILDAATGTGHTALALAAKAGRVIGIDAVPEMLDEASRAAAARGFRNIEWVRGSVERTGFDDAAFDIVTCRRAAHHFPDVLVFLAEVHRLLKPGGAFGIADQVAPEDAGVAAITEQMEKIHDPSHHRALPPSTWRALIRQVGFMEKFEALQEERRTIDQFLATAGDHDEKRLAIERMLGTASAEVLRKIGYDAAGGKPRFVKRRWIAVVLKVTDHP